MNQVKKILVLFPSLWDDQELKRLNQSGRFQFVEMGRELFEDLDSIHSIRFDFASFVSRAVQLSKNVQIDAVIGTHDYPGCLAAAVVARKLGLPGPDPVALLRFSHKYYSRVLQSELAPEATPDYQCIDPFGAGLSDVSLEYPIFLKPVKGMLSALARRIKNHEELMAWLDFSPLQKLAFKTAMRPMNQLLREYTDWELDADRFIAEECVEGDLVTLEAYVFQGQFRRLGVVDSVFYPGTESFSGFEYPSKLPKSVQSRMQAIVERLIKGAGFDNGVLNVEMMYDKHRDQISLIEVNPRMCSQFADLFEKVDGLNTYEVQLAISLGLDPEKLRTQSRFDVAKSYVLRRFSDARVQSVPSDVQVAHATRENPDARVHVLCKPKKKLSTQLQDAESFRYAVINLGAENPVALEKAFESAVSRLPFRFDNP